MPGALDASVCEDGQRPALRRRLRQGRVQPSDGRRASATGAPGRTGL